MQVRVQYLEVDGIEDFLLSGEARDHSEVTRESQVYIERT